MMKSLGIPIIAFIFGAASGMIAKFLMLFFQQLCSGAPPAPDWIAEAGATITGVGFAVLLFLRARAAIVSGKAAAKKEIMPTALLGIMGGLVSILTPVADAKLTGRQLEWDISGALLILVIVSAIFVAASYLFDRAGKKGALRSSEYAYRAALAMLIAGGVGTLLQVLFVLYAGWQGHNDPTAQCSEKDLQSYFRYGTTQFFISAPMGAFIFSLYAFSAVFLAQGIGKGGRASLAVLLTSAGGAIVISSIVAVTTLDKWAPLYGVYASGMLQMPAVWGAVLCGAYFAGARYRHVFSGMTGIVAFICALSVSLALVGVDGMTHSKAIWFSLAHGITASATAWAVSYAVATRLPATRADRITKPRNPAKSF